MRTEWGTCCYLATDVKNIAAAAYILAIDLYCATAYMCVRLLQPDRFKLRHKPAWLGHNLSLSLCKTHRKTVYLCGFEFCSSKPFMSSLTLELEIGQNRNSIRMNRTRTLQFLKQAQLSQRDRAMLRVVAYIAKSLKVIQTGSIQKLVYGFLFAFHGNYGCILYRFGDKARYWSKIAILYPLYSTPPYKRVPVGILPWRLVRKN